MFYKVNAQSPLLKTNQGIQLSNLFNGIDSVSINDIIYNIGDAPVLTDYFKSGDEAAFYPALGGNYSDSISFDSFFTSPIGSFSGIVKGGNPLFLNEKVFSGGSSGKSITITRTTDYLSIDGVRYYKNKTGYSYGLPYKLILVVQGAGGGGSGAIAMSGGGGGGSGGLYGCVIDLSKATKVVVHLGAPGKGGASSGDGTGTDADYSQIITYTGLNQSIPDGGIVIYGGKASTNVSSDIYGGLAGAGAETSEETLIGTTYKTLFVKPGVNGGRAYAAGITGSTGDAGQNPGAFSSTVNSSIFSGYQKTFNGAGGGSVSGAGGGGAGSYFGTGGAGAYAKSTNEADLAGEKGLGYGSGGGGGSWKQDWLTTYCGKGGDGAPACLRIYTEVPLYT